MASLLKLFVDTDLKKLVRSTVSQEIYILPKFAQGDVIDTELVLLSQNASGGIRSPYTVITDGLTVKIGLLNPNKAGTPKVYAQKDLTWDSAAAHYTGQLSLNTTEIDGLTYADDTVAAHQYRLEQARRMIRYIIIVQHPDAEPFRAYVALTADQETGAGYRPVAECIGNEKLRQQMLDDALKEMQRFERKYGLLVELVGLFSEVKRIHKTRAKG